MAKRLCVVLLAAFYAAPGLRAQWPQFRGPEGLGTSSATNVPLTWAEGRNIRWKTRIHGKGWSSPVVLEDRVWVTTATEDGKRLSVVALDRMTGRIVHDLEVFRVEHPQYAHPFNSYASPTAVIEPGRVYVTFGSPGTAAIDTRTGKVLWERRDIECNHFRGAGSSPILFGDLLIMHFDGSDRQFVIALDKRSGKTVWRTERSVNFRDLGADGKPEAEGDLRKAFATPHIITVAGRPMLLSLGSKAAYGYDPLTGAEVWRIEEHGAFSSSVRPVVGHGLVFYTTGFPTGQLFAVRPDGRGDATGTHVAWKVARGVSSKPSLLVAGDLLFMIGDAGIASCLDAKTGAEVWRARLGGSYSASPLLAAGRVYFFSEEGKTTVIAAGRTFTVLAENQMDDGFMASPAIDKNTLVLRTRTHVYAIVAE